MRTAIQKVSTFQLLLEKRFFEYDVNALCGVNFERFIIDPIFYLDLASLRIKERDLLAIGPCEYPNFSERTIKRLITTQREGAN